jgi:hypothetical protein
VLDPDEGELDDEEVGHAEPPPIERFHRTAVGSVLAASLLGLRDVLEPPKDEEPAIVVDYSGDPPFSDPFVLRLDPDHPEDSIVMVRPWLRDSAPPREHLASDGAPVEDVEGDIDTEPGSGRDS